MSAFTKKNLRDVEDSAVKGGFSENQEARFAGGDLDAERTGIALEVVKAGKRNAFGHRHEDAEEIYVVLSGEGRMRLDDEIIEVGPLDAIRVSPEVTRAFEAGAEDLQVLAVGALHEGDGEIVQDFWTD